MHFHFGKAISGGTPLSETEIDDLARNRIAHLRDALLPHHPAEKTDDVLALRLGEELRFVQRMIAMVEAQLLPGASGAAKRQLEWTEGALEDLAEVIEARNRCEAMGNIDPEISRRLTRRGLEGQGRPCNARF